MKVLHFLAALFLVAGALSAQAQEAESTAVSDEELHRYAVMMDSIDEMRITLLNEISEMVKNNDKITVARYNELSKIADNQEKLAAANATEDELAALKEIQEKKDAGTARINDAFKNLAKEYVGATAYNKIRKALKDEPEVKSKYESLLEELKADNGVVN
jgi:two-component sensor histidine kinase